VATPSQQPTAIATAWLFAMLTKDKRLIYTALMWVGTCNANFIPLRPDVRESQPHATTAKSHPSHGEIAFDKVGETSFMMGAAGMLMKFNVSHEIASLDMLEADLRAWAKDDNDRLHKSAGSQKSRPAYDRIVRALIDDIDAQRLRAITILRMKDPLFQASHSRRKRFLLFTTIFLVSLAVAATSAALGIYSTVELQNVKHEAETQGNVLAETVNATVEVEKRIINAEEAINSHGTHLNGIAASLMFQEVAIAVNAVSQRLANYENALAAAVNGRISPATLVNRDLKKALLHAGRTAARMHHRMLLRFPSDFLMCECSFLMTNTGFDIVAHIPIAPTDTILHVFQYNPVPIPVHDKFYGQPITSMTLLAVNNEEDKFRGITAATLSNCRKVGSVFMCDKFNSVRRAQQVVSTTHDEELCLFSLFRRKLDHARDTCKWRIIARPEALVQTNRQSFQLLAQQSHRAITTCWNASHTGEQEIEANAITKVTLTPGCRAQTEGHVMAAPMNGRTETFTRIHRTTPESFSLMEKADFDEIETLRQDSASFLFQRQDFEIGEATQAWMNSRSNSWSGFFSQGWKNPLSTMNFAAVAAAGLLVLLAFTLCKKAAISEHRFNNPVPSAPTMMFAINNKPNDQPSHDDLKF
jgi:hypothetical protein